MHSLKGAEVRQIARTDSRLTAFSQGKHNLKFSSFEVELEEVKLKLSKWEYFSTEKSSYIYIISRGTPNPCYQWNHIWVQSSKPAINMRSINGLLL